MNRGFYYRTSLLEHLHLRYVIVLLFAFYENASSIVSIRPFRFKAVPKLSYFHLQSAKLFSLLICWPNIILVFKDPVLRAKFDGKPEYVINYFFMVAEEVGISTNISNFTVSDITQIFIFIHPQCIMLSQAFLGINYHKCGILHP